MQTFSELFIAARKKKGLTQEALAKAAAVTRQTVSSWERGRTIPDVNMIRRLSDILDVDLLQAAEAERALAAEKRLTEAGNSAGPDEAAADEFDLPVEEMTAEAEADAPDEEAATDDGPQAVPDPSHDDDRRGGGARSVARPWIIAAAALACAALALCLLLPRRVVPAAEGETFDAETYRQEAPGAADAAHITFDNRTWTENNGGTDYQRYDFTMTENHGIGFSVTRIESKMASKSGAVRVFTASAADISGVVDPEIAPYGSLTIDGGYPLGEFDIVGITVYGEDANGAALTFRDLIEFG